jgi:hypothetical protein
MHKSCVGLESGRVEEIVMPEPEFYAAAFVDSLRRKAHAAPTLKPTLRATLRGYFDFLSRNGRADRPVSDEDGSWTVSARNPEQLLAASIVFVSSPTRFPHDSSAQIPFMFC